VLLSNFLVELHASPMEIGLLAAIPMTANLLQPLGAMVCDRTTSRQWYHLWIFGPARSVWLILVVGIWLFSQHRVDSDWLINWTLATVCITYVLASLGSASWLSWMAVLVPRRLRGRYFGFRNGTSSLTSLICVPLLGFAVSAWPGGSLEGYGVILGCGVVMGLISLGFQFLMADINPQERKKAIALEKASSDPAHLEETGASALTADLPNLLQDPNFLKFLLYLSLWTFAVNISGPFFNLYLLDNLSLDVSWVAVYNGMGSAANLILLMIWGKVADRFGNRPILLLVGILVAVTPLLWLGVNTNSFNLWLWLPFLHMLAGGTWAAIDLCNNNIQMQIAPTQHHAAYFAIAAAIGGVSGALGTTTGGFLAQSNEHGGFLGLFALSSVLRLVALLPLVLVQENRSYSIRKLIRGFWV
ncbi:MAG: MFS transporter, partial [Leptolyngbyaceae cyanobacterium bins.59]|nr:MFS transporter [Leptolyngbyaceae cyanobacterium bins.59]